MSDGYLTPAAAFKAAKALHVDRDFDVSVRLLHPAPSGGGVRYRGDEERRAGRTAEVSVELRGNEPHSLDELVTARARILELGYRAELEHGSRFVILGPTA